MISRTWSQEFIELPGYRVRVVSETLALAFSAGPGVRGYGLKIPRYVVVEEGGKTVVRSMDGIERTPDHYHSQV
jgi:hypothetical protein